MEKNCEKCREIIAFQNSLDNQSELLVRMVKYVCAPIISRNNKKWEDFASLSRTPVIGNIIYEIFRSPGALERIPDYFNSSWFGLLGRSIEADAEKLEIMKHRDIEHWGDELVKAYFPWDYSGYYEHCHPTNPMKRSDAYKSYEVFGSERSDGTVSFEGLDKLKVFLPEKYDFHSAAGGDKFREGEYVMDSITKNIVPINDCNWSWTALQDTAITIPEKIVAKFARSGTVYKQYKNTIQQ